MGHRQTGQVAIQSRTLALPTPPGQLPFEERPAELFQNLDNLVGLAPTQGLQGPADACIIGPTFLVPGFGHGLVFVQGMGRPAEVLQVGQAARVATRDPSTWAWGVCR